MQAFQEGVHFRFDQTVITLRVSSVQPLERFVGLVPEADLPGTNKFACTFSRYQCNFAYSALACFRIGMSGSASSQIAKNSSYHLRAVAWSPMIS